MLNNDEETSVVVRDWLRRYSFAIIAGVAIAIAIIFGFQWWQNHQQRGNHYSSNQLSDLMIAVNDNDTNQAINLYQKLKTENSIYSDMAALMVAKVYHQLNQSADAEAALKIAIESKDKLISQTATLSLAQLQIDEKNYNAALPTLSQLENGAYDGRINVLRGDIYLLQNHLEKALDSYQRSQKEQPSSLMEMRISLIKAQIASLTHPNPAEGS